MPLIHFVDVETSGTSDSDEVLECAVVAWRDGHRQTLYHKHFFAQGIVSADAQKINGYDQNIWWQKHDAQWLTARYVGELAGALQELEILAGFAPAFQRRMIYSMFRRMRMKYPSIGKATIDVCGLAAPLLFKGLPNLSTEAVCQALGVPGSGGNALADCNRAIDVFEKLLGCYWSGLK